MPRKYSKRVTAVVERPEVASIGGALEGAERNNKETAFWNPTRLSPDQIINGLGGGPFGGLKDEADARGRDVVTNDGFGQGIVDINRDAIVGGQYRLNAQPNYIVLGRMISKSFDEVWAEEYQEAVEEKFNLVAESDSNWFDASRVLTFTGLIRLGLASFVYTGESLASCEWIREKDRPFNTAIQLISPARLTNPRGQMDSNVLRRGVARNQWGAPTGYWIRDAYPTEIYNPDVFKWTFVPTAKPWGRRMVIHVKDTIQPSQTRGISGLVAVLKQMRMTKKYQDVVLQNAVINASYAATVESELPSDVIAAALGQGQTTDVASGFAGLIGTYLSCLKSYLTNANGIQVDGAKIPHLFPGTTLNTRPLGTPGGVGTDFEASLLRHTAAGLGLSYEEFANDFSRTNYSSGKMSIQKTNRHMRARKKFVADKMATELYALWIEEDLNSGNLPMPRNYDWRVFYQPYGKEALTSCDWIGAGLGQIDEMKETQAALLRVNGGLSTFEIEIGKMGGDWRKFFRQRQREIKLQEKYGLVFSTNAKKDGATSGAKVMNDQAAQDNAGQNSSDTPAAGADADPVEVNLDLEEVVDELKTGFSSIISAIQNPPEPKPKKEKTTVLKHDSSGRILEYVREEIK